MQPSRIHEKDGKAVYQVSQKTATHNYFRALIYILYMWLFGLEISCNEIGSISSLFLHSRIDLNKYIIHGRFDG